MTSRVQRFPPRHCHNLGTGLALGAGAVPANDWPKLSVVEGANPTKPPHTTPSHTGGQATVRPQIVGPPNARSGSCLGALQRHWVCLIIRGMTLARVTASHPLSFYPHPSIRMLNPSFFFPTPLRAPHHRPPTRPHAT